MGLTTVEATATLDEVLAVIDRDGGVIVRDFLDRETIAGLEADLRPILEVQGWGGDEFMGQRTRRVGGLFKHSKRGAAIVRQPLFLGAAEHYLRRPVHVWTGEERLDVAPTLQVGATQVIDIYPGEGSQLLHRDDMVWHWRHPEGGGQARVQAMVAVTDFTAENGGTLVVPGSHKWSDDRAPKTSEAVPTVMKQGSALIWLGATYHAGGKNTSRSSRTGITVTLDRGYLRQEENAYLTYPPEIAETLDPDVQKLIGYQACDPFMGYVEINGVMSDPSALFKDPDASAMGLGR
jgi:ectoine hydroxylase-related dioxygenase (phytanoyl-CoA dioxygenase family)